MIVSTIRMAIPAEKHDDALRIIRSISAQCTNDPGCISYNVYRDIADYNVLMIQEYWRSEESMNLHISSDDYRNLLLVLELSLKQPEVRFDNISSSMGIEAVEKIRSTLSRL